MEQDTQNHGYSPLLLADMNREIFGSTTLKIRVFRRFLRDMGSYYYLLKHFKLKELYNFAYTKTYVPTGEGFFLGLGSKLTRYPDTVPVPKFIEIETTTVCDKKCVICEYVYWPKGDQVKRHMKLEEFKHIVHQFPVIRWANLTGEGSAFLNKDYTSMIRYLWELHRTSIWLVDHLVDISIEKLEKEVFPFIHGIYLSMDAATKDAYESIKKGCKFDNVVTNLKNVIGYKIRRKTPFPHLSFRYIIIKDNVHEMALFLDLLNSIANPGDWGGSSSFVEFTGLLYFPEIMKYYVSSIPRDVINEIVKRKNGIEFQFSHAEENRNPPIEKCVAWLEPYIMMPGYVLPCCAVIMSNRRPFLRNYSFGNVFEKNFKEIWASEYYTKFRSMVNDPSAPVPKICVGCRAYQTRLRVGKHGIWDIKQTTGNK